MKTRILMLMAAAFGAGFSAAAQEHTTNRRAVIFPMRGEAFDGYIVSAEADTLVVVGDGERRIAAADLAKVIVLQRGKRGMGFGIGSLVGTYFASFLWSQSVGNAVPATFFYDYSDLWVAPLVLGIALGGGFGELTAPGMRQDAEEEFSLGIDSLRRAKEWQRLRTFITESASAPKFRVAFCGASVTLPNEARFIEAAKATLHGNLYGDYVSSFNLSRAVYCSYRLQPWLEAGIAALSFSERLLDTRFNGTILRGDTLMSVQSVNQATRISGFYLTAALLPLPPHLPIEARMGIGLGAAFPNYERSADFSMSARGQTLFTGIQRQIIRESRFSALLFADVSWYIFGATSVGLYADIAFASPVTIDATPLLPAQTLVIGNSGVGFRLGFRF